MVLERRAIPRSQAFTDGPGASVTCVGGTTRARVQADADDDLLVARVVAGDDAALAALYKRHGGYVFSLALRVSRDRSIAEDVTQEVFVFLWTHGDRYDPARGTAASWLSTVAYRRTVDRIRQDETRRAREDRDRVLSFDGPADLSDDVVADMTNERVRRAVNSLPAEQRSCIELAYFGGITFREVATRLGIAEGTAKSRIRLALNKLATELEEVAR